MSETTKCKSCQVETDRLDLFPGDVCLACWAKSPEGRHLPTADELRQMFGDKR